VAAADRLKPDIVVLDISMPLLNGLEAARQIKHNLRNVKLIFVTMNEDTDLAAEAFRAGASAYVLKQSATSELLTAIREVMEGHSYVTPLITEGLVGSLMRHDAGAPSQELTARQREVLQLLAEGRSMKEVADLLNLTPRTVAFHKYRIMEQLKVKSTAELVRYAVKHHIV
jgi:DNA-binding NarL/FixJ family response regulator